MENTLNPEEIYEVFSKGGFSILRIDNFKKGDYAEIRAELEYGDNLSINNMQELTFKLRIIEESESVKITVYHINMDHKTISLSFKVV